jgi:hypothetical protein
MRTALLLLPLLLAACRTTQTSERSGPTSVALTRAEPVRAWELWQEGKLLGVLVRFEDTADARRAFYSVRNREGQEIGLVDLDGRAWRHRPHESRPEWLGTGTVIEGSRRILGGSAQSQLVEVELEKLREILERFHTSAPPPSRDGAPAPGG